MSDNVKVPVEVYSRVSGYYRPVKQWNKGKQEEFSCRSVIDVNSISIESAAGEVAVSIS